MTLEINIEDQLNKQKIESNRIEFKKGWNPVGTLDDDEYSGSLVTCTCRHLQSPEVYGASRLWLQENYVCLQGT